MPHVCQMYHDRAGPTGLSPYQIVYGRERHNAGVPYEGVKAEAAEAWFQKQKYILKGLQTTLQQEQDKRMAKANEASAQPTKSQVGE